MFPYASRTGTRRNLARLRAAGWGLMVSAKGRHRTEGFARYAVDNGAWWAYANKQFFDERAFLVVYDQLAAGADFVVLPDIVAGGLRSLEFSLRWRERLGPAPCPLMLAVQDGMQPSDVCGFMPMLGIFVGGTSEWKEQSLPEWGELARATGAHLHVGRVNTARRVHLCQAASVDSFDGSSVSRYSINLPLLENARRQLDIFAIEPKTTCGPANGRGEEGPHFLVECGPEP